MDEFSQLKLEHDKLYAEIIQIVKSYKKTKDLLETNLIFFTKEEMKETQARYKKTMKKLNKKYIEIREEIYSIEDSIANINEDELDNIVKPLPDSIEDWM